MTAALRPDELSAPAPRFPEKPAMSSQDALTGSHASSSEPIPGYRLQERIGRGGYGEVWKTLAPGGVPKAIKLIYGEDPTQRVTELRALNRIKDVRHPFLLSIERIEQNGDCLAIVTELGDKNLQEYFRGCLARELPGIPQDELLAMMRDVADVLDYIYQEYALQHLDIKPANLLLFGRRLKVADFGLVMNIYERSSSLVQGLTPTYAAPEIFEGQPTRASDQYSLAILYQEMLTGALPFNGTTAARLATQHLRENPDLTALPMAQRPIIARALSKDPQQRFACCMELIEELTAAAKRSPASPAAGIAKAHFSRDLLVKPAATPTPAEVSTASTQSHAAGDTNQTLKPVPQKCRAVPTILIGIGGTAGKTLQRLRLRIADRLGGMGTLPAFKMLFLDVDTDTLNEMNHDQLAWNDLETVPTPLRSSAEYREQGHLHRRWLSRRWLFNVPRNLRTEGLRPLGRLALVTNASRVLASLRSAILHVTSACPETPPRILLVASISGGTGSGMLADLAYAARHELHSAGFPDAPVDGVLLHSTPTGSGRDKAVLNAIATMTELEHFSAAGSFYPGEPMLQTPPFHGNNQTFTKTQFLHLGEDLDTAVWLRAIDNVAELLYCRLLTNLDQALSTSPVPARSSASMDLVQVQQIGGYAGTFVDDLTRQLCVDIIDGWCGSEPQGAFGERNQTSSATMLLNSMEHSQNAKNQQLTAEAEQKTLACGVDVQQLVKQAREMLHQELKGSQRDFLQAQFDEAVKAVADDVPDHEVARLTLAMQDRIIGLDFGERPQDSSRNTLFDLLHSRLASQAMPIAGRYITWVCDLIDQPRGGVDAARHVAEAGRNCIRDLISVLGKAIVERQSQQTNSRIRLSTSASPDEAAKNGRSWLTRRANPRTVLAEKLIQHGLCSFEELTEVLVQWQLRTIEANLSALIDHLLSMWQELKQLGKRMANDATAHHSDSTLPTPYEQSLRKLLLEHRPRLVQELRTNVERDIFAGSKKLQRFLQQRCSYDHALGDPLRRLARKVVLHSIEQVLSTILRHNSQPLDNHELSIDGPLSKLFQNAWPIEAGDAESAVVMVPEETGELTFHSRTVPALPRVPLMTARTNNVTVCRERRGAPIQQVIHSVAHGQRELLSIAANLLTRIDVEWKTPGNVVQTTATSDPAGDSWSDVVRTVPLGSLQP